MHDFRSFSERRYVILSAAYKGAAAMDNAPENVAQLPDYLSYLLRLWRMQGEAALWRCSLESPHTGERLGFGSLDELFAFLREQTGTTPGTELAGGPAPLKEMKTKNG